MNENYSELIQFYSQKLNVPIELVRQPWQLECRDKHQIAVGLPCEVNEHRVIGDMIVAMNPDFGKCIGGDLIVVEDVPVARVSEFALLILFTPKNPTAQAFVRGLIDDRLPKLCRNFRKSIRDQMIEKYTGCVSDRKRELLSSIREDDYELDRLSTQMMTLSRKLETDRQLLRMFEKSADFIKARATRCYFDLMKLVPGTYKSFHFSGDAVFGTTYVIEIEYDGYHYEFEPFVVEVSMRKGEVLIAGGTDVNGYVHPHVTDDPSNVCWGNIQYMVSRLAGSLDLFELFQLVHQFLCTYNEGDPFQKIEHWNPDWCGDDESVESYYCEYCDSYSDHTIDDCPDCRWCEECSANVDIDHECPYEVEEEEEAHALEGA